MNTLYKFTVVLVGISLVLHPVAVWAAKGPCSLRSAKPTEGEYECAAGQYSGTVIEYEETYECDNADETDCNSSESLRVVSKTYNYSTTQSPAQQKAQQDEYDAVGTAYVACNAAMAAAAIGNAWAWSWLGPAGTIIAGGVVGIVGGITCQVAYNQQMSAHNANVNNCAFVSPKKGVGSPNMGGSCE